MTPPRRHPNLVNRDEVEPILIDRGRHRAERRQLGSAAGSRQLGGSLMEVPPGGRSYPFHYHCANEEAIYVLSGTGTARIGDARVPVRAGDWIAKPEGTAVSGCERSMRMTSEPPCTEPDTASMAVCACAQTVATASASPRNNFFQGARADSML